MEKITDAMSIFDNGECWPHDELVFPEIAERGATKIVEKRWVYRDHPYQINLLEAGFVFVDLLPDMTGFCGLIGSHPWAIKKAHILNGDATIRHILKPVVNVRGVGLDAVRLPSKKGMGELEDSRMPHPLEPHADQAIFHNKTARADVLEIFGDDGYGDCYYRYDSTTGELLSTEALPGRS